MDYSHILWDFNGTILDDVGANIQATNTLLVSRGLDPIPNRAFYHQVFGFPIIDYYRRLGFDFSKESYDELALAWSVEYEKNAKNTAIHPGIRETLERVRAAGIPQLVLSASKRTMLVQQLDDLGILPYFDTLLGLDTFHAHSKATLGIEWMERVHPRHAVLLGDTVHDYEAAAAMGIDCILIANGHASFEILSALPCPVYRDIRDVPLIG